MILEAVLRSTAGILKNLSHESTLVFNVNMKDLRLVCMKVIINGQEQPGLVHHLKSSASLQTDPEQLTRSWSGHVRLQPTSQNIREK